MSAAPAKEAHAGTEPAAVEEKALAFPRGLVGLKGPLRFAVVGFPGGGETIKFLQCLDHPDLAFTLVDPWAFFPDYRPEATDQDLDDVGLERVEDGIWVCIATVPQDFRQSTVNLRAPLLINAFRQLAKQVVLVQDYPVRQPLFRA